MTQRKLLLLIFSLLLIPAGLVAAQSSTNYKNQRFVIVGGSLAGSTSFSVTSVIGQPATDVGNSANYNVSGGYLWPLLSASSPGANKKTWLPLIVK